MPAALLVQSRGAHAVTERLRTDAGNIIRRMEGASDEELVARTRIDGLSQSRRDEILNELFGRYHSRVAVWCLRMTGDRNAAADLAQDVLLRAWRSLDSWQGQSKFSTWMYSIMRNHCINDRAARSVRPEGASDPLNFDVSDQSARPDRQAERNSEVRRMNELIGSALDRTEAQVMTLHYGEEMTLDAITRLLSLTNASGAKAYIVSARRKLKAAVSLSRSSGGRKER
jgi:RNA polymerase sigma-70 factor, ECF subfamily